VGLAGDFGQVTLGRNGTPSDLYMGATSPWGINGIEPITLFRGEMPVIDGVRWDNSIAYASPKFSGLDLMAIYSFGEKTSRTKLEDASGNTLGYDCSTTTNSAGVEKQTCYEAAKTSDAGKLGLGLRYANGPLYVSAIYQLHRDDGSLESRNRTRTSSAAPWGTWSKWDDGGDNGYRGWAIGGSYDFKVVKVYANYFRAKANGDGRATGTDDGSDKKTTWSLGVGVPVSSAGTVVAEYAQYKDYYKSYGKDEDKAGKAVGYSVGYRHNLSKRTSLYTYLTRINNKEEGLQAGWSKSNHRDAPGENQTVFTAGISHYF
jgi:predicted porin